MTRNEAIKVLQNEVACVQRETCERPECASCDLVLPVEKVLSAYDMAISALCTQQKQESECAKCSGIIYRQTDSGKIIPVGQRCGAKITPPCYVPDGDGCAYQIYGDNNDEPIDRCKSCPLCQSDKIRHKQESVHNDPLTLDELRQMDGEPVWVQSPGVPEYGRWAIVEGAGENCLFLHDDFTCHDYGKTWLAYRQKPVEGTYVQT